MGLGISRTRLDSLPSVSGIGADGGRAKTIGTGNRKIPAANGLRRNPAVDSDAKSILSGRSGRSGGSGGSKDSRYHLNTGQPVVSIKSERYIIYANVFVDDLIFILTFILIFVLYLFR